MHGGGLCDEWPLIAYPDKLVEGAFNYEIQTSMLLCIEASVSPKGSDFFQKLEDQVLMTETRLENLSKYPFNDRLMGRV